MPTQKKNMLFDDGRLIIAIPNGANIWNLEPDEWTEVEKNKVQEITFIEYAKSLPEIHDLCSEDEPLKLNDFMVNFPKCTEVIFQGRPPTGKELSILCNINTENEYMSILVNDLVPPIKEYFDKYQLKDILEKEIKPEMFKLLENVSYEINEKETEMGLQPDPSSLCYLTDLYVKPDVYQPLQSSYTPREMSHTHAQSFFQETSETNIEGEKAVLLATLNGLTLNENDISELKNLVSKIESRAPNNRNDGAEDESDPGNVPH